MNIAIHSSLFLFLYGQYFNFVSFSAVKTVPLRQYYK